MPFILDLPSGANTNGKTAPVVQLPLVAELEVWPGFLESPSVWASGCPAYSLCLGIYWRDLIKQKRDLPATTKVFDLMLNCKFSPNQNI